MAVSWRQLKKHGFCLVDDKYTIFFRIIAKECKKLRYFIISATFYIRYFIGNVSACRQLPLDILIARTAKALS